MSCDFDVSTLEFEIDEDDSFGNNFDMIPCEIDMEYEDPMSVFKGTDETSIMSQIQTSYNDDQDEIQSKNDDKQMNQFDNHVMSSNQFNEQQMKPLQNGNQEISSIQNVGQQISSIQNDNQQVPIYNQQSFINPGYLVQQVFIVPYNNQQMIHEQNNLLVWRRRSPKRKIILSNEADELKSRYYSTFTSKKSFPKELILEIHRQILTPQLGLPKMTRDERRQKDIYFQNYAFMKEKMLKCLEQNKERILNTILKDIGKKNM